MNDRELLIDSLRKHICNLERKIDNQPSTQWPDDAPEWANYYAKKLDEIFLHDLFGKNLDGYIIVERPKPVKQKIDWSKLHNTIRRDYWCPDFEYTPEAMLNLGCFPSPWIAWNCDEHTRGNPLPDGLIIVWYEVGEDRYVTSKVTKPNWRFITRFRIVGIQEGWE